MQLSFLPEHKGCYHSPCGKQQQASSSPLSPGQNAIEERPADWALLTQQLDVLLPQSRWKWRDDTSVPSSPACPSLFTQGNSCSSVSAQLRYRLFHSTFTGPQVAIWVLLGLGDKYGSLACRDPTVKLRPLPHRPNKLFEDRDPASFLSTNPVLGQVPSPGPHRATNRGP